MTARTPSQAMRQPQEQKPHNTHGQKDRHMGVPDACRDTSRPGAHLWTSFMKEGYVLIFEAMLAVGFCCLKPLLTCHLP